MRHIGALDGLRAVAVIGVLAFHAGHLSGGFLGVDLFFALSGFLITSLILRDIDAGSFSVSRFWGRRFRRLLPAALALIAVVTAVTAIAGSVSQRADANAVAPWAVVYLANWREIFWGSSGYWASFAEPSAFTHLWSLAVEEQFYVIWPLVALGVGRASRKPSHALAAVAAVLSVASVVAMIALYSPGDPTRVYMGTDTRAASILVGAVVACFPGAFTALVARRARPVGVVMTVAVGTVVASWFLIDGTTATWLFRGGLFLHSAVCAVAIGLLSAKTPAAGNWPLARVLAVAPMQWVGRHSYSLYLWHWPIYIWLDAERLGRSGWTLTAARVVASFAAAVVSMRLIENPIRFGTGWFQRWRTTAPTTALLVATAALTFGGAIAIGGQAGNVASFEPSNLAGSVTTTTQSVDTPIDTAPHSTVSITPRPTSTTTTTLAPPTESIGKTLMVGDSVAFDLAAAFEASMTAAGVEFESRAFQAMRLHADDPSFSITGNIAPTLTEVAPATVILPLPVFDAIRSIDDERLVTALEEFTFIVVANGVRVVLVSPPPVGTDADRDIDLDSTPLLTASRAIAARSDSVTFVDSAELWGARFVMDTDGDGTPERKRDRVHLCAAGAALYAVWLTDRLAELFLGVSPVLPVVWAGGDWVQDPRYDTPVGSCAPL